MKGREMKVRKLWVSFNWQRGRDQRVTLLRGKQESR